MPKSYVSHLRPTRIEATGIVEYFFDRVALTTPEDVFIFFDEFVASLDKFPKPLDVVVCLDGLTVAPAAREAYGRERARVAIANYRHSARYAGPTQTRISTMTSAVRYNADGLVYQTREEAFEAILKARKKAGEA